jgi:hypothetical protein
MKIRSGRIYRKNCHDCGQGIQVLRLSWWVSVLSSQFPVRSFLLRPHLAMLENSAMSSPFLGATATQVGRAAMPISEEVQGFPYPDVQFISYTAQLIVQVLLEQMRGRHSP